MSPHRGGGIDETFGFAELSKYDFDNSSETKKIVGDNTKNETNAT